MALTICRINLSATTIFLPSEIWAFSRRRASVTFRRQTTTTGTLYFHIVSNNIELEKLQAEAAAATKVKAVEKAVALQACQKKREKE